MKLINPVEAPDGTPRSFYTYKIPFGRLCRCIAAYPGVEFTKRPGFTLSSEDVMAEFKFRGHDFTIKSIWADIHVCPKDDEAAYPEIVEIEHYVEQNGHSVLGKLIRKFWKKKTLKMPTRS